jgi:hypothetical protein
VPSISALRKAGKNAVAVDLDGEPWRKLPSTVVLACGLRPGLELDRTRLRRLRTELRRVEAIGLAGRLLRHRDLAAERLEAELARRHVPPADRREALNALRRAGIVDDARLASRRAQTLAERGPGFLSRVSRRRWRCWSPSATEHEALSSGRASRPGLRAYSLGEVSGRTR